MARTLSRTRTTGCGARALGAAVAVLLALVPGLAPGEVHVGQPAPSVVFRSAEGQEYPIERTWRSRSVLLAFVSPYCDPCHESLDDRPGPEIVYAVLGPLRGRSGGFPFPATAVAADENAAAAYGVQESPAYFLLGRGGTVLWRHYGPLSRDGGLRALEDAIEADAIVSSFLHR